MYERTYGSNYNADLSTTDIAKRTREWIKTEKKAGRIDHGFKFSIRCKYFSGGSSIDAGVTEFPESWGDEEIFNGEYYRLKADTSKGFLGVPRGIEQFTEKVQRVLDSVTDYIQSYNHDGSEIQVDYFDVKFYFIKTEITWNSPAYDREAAYTRKIAAEIKEEKEPEAMNIETGEPRVRPEEKPRFDWLGDSWNS